MLWAAEEPLRGSLGLGALFNPLQTPAAHCYPQLDFSELSCLLYHVCHWLQVLLLKIWLWPDWFCAVRCFGVCHGFVNICVIFKVLKRFNVPTWGVLKAKALAVAALRLVLGLGKAPSQEILEGLNLKDGHCPHRITSICHGSSFLPMSSSVQHCIADHLCFWM